MKKVYLDKWTGKPCDPPWETIHDNDGEPCEHCGTPTICNCVVCGAPVCCPKCCYETEQERNELT